MEVEKMVTPLEIRRKIFHVVFGLFCIELFIRNLITPLIVFGVVIVGGIISYLSRSYKIPGVWWFLKKFERPQHLASFPGKGAWFFAVGFFLCILLFKKNIAIASIIVMVLGDSISHIIGTNFGAIKHPFSNTKFIEGHIVGAIVSGFAASAFVPFWIGLIGALGGMFMEGVDAIMKIDPVDDNVVVPLSAGIIMTLLNLIASMI